MSVVLKRPWLGVAIPSFLISFIAYGAHIFILKGHISVAKQLVFQLSVTMIWISYLLAIYTNPGKPPKTDPRLDVGQLKYCTKCECFKPERAHHCKTCKQCVLMMDHHCPWTLNCVGYDNFPHFLRFLIWIIISTSQLIWYFTSRILQLWKFRNSPSSLFPKSEIISLTILVPLNFFVFCTISLLLIRCVTNQIICGRTQIENWEMERLESLFYSKRLLPILLRETWRIYPNERNDSHENEAKILLEKNQARKISFHSCVNFPYDIDILTNFNQNFGSILTLLLPFGKPNGNGLIFPKNEISLYERGSSLEDIILSLPWPPDGGRKAANEVVIEEQQEDIGGVEEIIEDGEHLIRKRSNIPTRASWENQWGEHLEDFGVDVADE